MNETTKRRALWAASKVTFSTMAFGVTTGAALFGAIACGDDEANVPVGERDGTQAGETKGTSKQPDDKATSAATTSTPPQKDPPKNDDRDPPNNFPALCEDVACCNAKVGPLLDEDDVWAWDDEKAEALRAKLGPDGVACCKVLIQASVDDPDGARSPDHWACCSVLSAPATDAQIGACTPWGPPTPPSFDDEAFALALRVVA